MGDFNNAVKGKSFAEQLKEHRAETERRKAAKSSPEAKAARAKRRAELDAHLKGTRATRDISSGAGAPPHPTGTGGGSVKGKAKDKLKKELGIR